MFMIFMIFQGYFIRFSLYKLYGNLLVSILVSNARGTTTRANFDDTKNDQFMQYLRILFHFNETHHIEKCFHMRLDLDSNRHGQQILNQNAARNNHIPPPEKISRYLGVH